MTALFNSYIYEPILSVLLFIYNSIAFTDLGIAIILLTIFIRVVLFPLFYKGAKDQAIMQKLQPHIKKIQLDHKDNKEEQAKLLLDLYKKYSFNPFFGIFSVVIQLPIFFALFKMFGQELGNLGIANTMMFGFLDLGTKGFVLPVIAAGLQYIQGKLSLPNIKSQAGDNPMASMGKMMIYIGPILTLLIFSNLPSALSVYWIVSSLFAVVQQIYINKKLPKLED
ncbi:protein translocase component YidC [Candidatus Parcubacteria bacterium]|jgi:YidC/Oxa1 family membrane protein insertase|nr:MAG: protein translocase component YidC [Candidatus Parcubacteria bacterium]